VGFAVQTSFLFDESALAGVLVLVIFVVNSFWVRSPFPPAQLVLFALPPCSPFNVNALVSSF